ncbi:MAG: DUF3106 domain-containing protein [Acidobacteria bacterium]|nr:DUF3106 domain-containing protein [Acidobacteriota bacterium]MBS1867125.1 DUF3106 domain-containing protein [Acidobacteriota bacterium]
MNKGLKFGSWFVALGLAAVVVFPAEAQNRPPKPRQEQRQEQRQERRQERRQQQPQRNANNPNRPPSSGSNQTVAPNTYRPPEHARNQQNPNRPPVNTQPKSFNNLNPQEKQRTLNQYNKFQKLTPSQQQDLRDRGRVWNQMTPEQRSHIKNDVLPKWKQLPPQRQRAIQQRLGVLKNMPESARIQHLADPNFTRGMNEEDKSMLQDLSHLHVGGAPDEPHE